MPSEPDSTQFRIHGDNIVECERTLSLILGAFGADVGDLSGPLGPCTCPEFRLRLRPSNITLKFVYFPGFGRWSYDVLALTRSLGAPLREAADAIITDASDGYERPVMAVEYCGALPAGNQAWQRNGRAYSFARAGVPYVYIAELGGYELDANRERKAERAPNPAVPFSYLALSENLDTMALPVFVPSPGAAGESVKSYAGVFGDQVLRVLLRDVLLGRGTDGCRKALEHKTLEVVRLLASGRRRQDSLAPDEWASAYKAIAGGQSLPDYLLSISPIKWAKTAYIKDLTKSARTLMDVASRHAVGLTSTSLPMCVIASASRAAFARRVRAVYGSLPSRFQEWLSRPEHLAVCWVMGFKPGGDDARPDRGLAPLARMLIGERHDLLTVVYGPAPRGACDLLARAPASLAERNGLWEAIFAVSGAVLIDSCHAPSGAKYMYVRDQLTSERSAADHVRSLVDRRPLQFGENDVDTALHLFFSWSSLDDRHVFEGMCNPPGGDWSGMSLRTPDGSFELRWLSLPRVTDENAKRPDHIFQIPAEGEPIVLAVESKGRASALEAGIGPRLTQYVQSLVSSTASIERSVVSGNGPWQRPHHGLAAHQFSFASAVAFACEPHEGMERLAEAASADLILGCAFAPSGDTCLLRALPRTPLGERVLSLMLRMRHADVGITVQPASS